MAFFAIPRPLRQGVKALVSKKAAQAVAKKITPFSKGPAKTRAATPAQETVKTEVARRLFDAKWYAARYPDAPQDHEEAYRSYLATGIKEGRIPNSQFENVRFPSRARIPQRHIHRITASPILSRVPPARYLAAYQPKKRLNRSYNTFEDYIRRAMVMPDLIGPSLWENDFRIVSYMDSGKRKLAAKAVQQPQGELVSIMMPIRNGTATMADAIASVLMQTYQNWELVIVHGPGNAADIQDAVTAFSDSRITSHCIEDAAGIGQILNAGIERSSGNVVAYLESDALWDPDHLLILVDQMHERGATLAYAAHGLWDGFDPDIRLGSAFKAIRFAPFNRSLLENANYVSLSALVHKRALLKEIGLFPPALQEHADWDLVLWASEVERPIAIPCLLAHRFLQTADDAVSPDDCSGEVRTRLIERSAWSQPYATVDGGAHLAFSTAQKSREARWQKLSALPVEPVQILIPNYESLGELEMCLHSIAEHTSSPYEVLIVDNGSSEETYAKLSALSASLDHVRLIREKENSGFSFAVNRGLQEIVDKDQKILILNNDTLVTPDWLDELRYVLHKHENAGMAVPRQVLPAGSKPMTIHVPEASMSFECDINMSAKHENILDPTFDLEDSLVELSYAPLFCGLIRPETIKKAGFLDSGNGPHYRSDWILCDSIRRHLNQRIIYTPHSKIYHLQGVATRQRKSSEDDFLAHSHRSPPTKPQT